MSKPAVKEHKTPLTVQQNVEGLCYDKTNNRLLAAIKDEEPGNPGYKGIYGFDLTSKKMAEQPVFKIDMGHKLFAGAKTKKGKKTGMAPSSLAIHPQTGDMYLTDGRKPKLLILNNKGEIKSLYELDETKFSQPEGITFKPDGELYIANEGTKQPGNIVRVELAAE